MTVLVFRIVTSHPNDNPYRSPILPWRGYYMPESLYEVFVAGAIDPTWFIPCDNKALGLGEQLVQVRYIVTVELTPA